MIVHVHTLARNEAYMLPYFLRHYLTFADRIFILDDGSTDETPTIAANAGRKVRLEPYPFDTGLDDEKLHQALNESVAARSAGVADWVICPDVDEFLMHPKKDMRRLLREAKTRRMRVLGSLAYFMVAEAPVQTDAQLYEVVRQGVRPRKTSPRYTYDKVLIFEPTIGAELGPGRHRTNIPASVRVDDMGIWLLHFCYFGFPYIQDRITRNVNRMLALTPEARATMLRVRLSRARADWRIATHRAGTIFEKAHPRDR